MRPSVSWRVSKAEYSAWTASILATGGEKRGRVSGFVHRFPVGAIGVAGCWKYVLEFALRSVAAEHSERPMYFVLPALRIASRAGMECSRGVSC